MKIHRHLVVATLQALDQVFVSDQYSDKVIERLFKQNPKWGAKDRKFVAEGVFETVRHWRLLWELIDSDPVLPLVDVNSESLEDHRNFVVGPQGWAVMAYGLKLRGHDLPHWPEFEEYSDLDLARQMEEFEKVPAIFFSIPDWINEVCLLELGVRWNRVIKALNEPARVVLRANTLKVRDRIPLHEALFKEGISTQIVELSPDALVLTERKNVFSTQSFKLGHFEVQDAASQRVALLIDPKPGEKVVDACAGGGGKTLHMAALMKNQGRIWAMDVEDWKLKELRKRSSRAGVDIIETRQIETGKTIKRMKGRADALLLDVPCSGLGVLRRNPDTKWKLKSQDLDRLRSLQFEILENYSEVVRQGGRMVYATCSILRSENEDQVQKFLNLKSGWALEKEERYWPDEHGYDGFYAALLRRIH